MGDHSRTILITALAFVAGLLIASAGGPSAAVAQDSSPPSAAASAPPELSGRVAYLERSYRGMYTELQGIKQTIRLLQAKISPTGGGNEQRNLTQKVTELEKKLEGHTHEYLQEGRASDGSIRALPPEQFSGAGLNSTGIYRVGKAVFH